MGTEVLERRFAAIGARVKVIRTTTNRGHWLWRASARSGIV